jgi:hypothetical protein
MCSLGHLAKAIYQALLKHRHALEADATWLSFKPGEIVYLLCDAAKEEFTHCIPFRAFLEGDITGAYQPPNVASLVDKCVSPVHAVLQSVLPKDLRQRPLPGPAPRPAPNGTSNRGAATPGNRGRTANTSATPPANPQANNRNNPNHRANPNFHANFKNFWQSLPPEHQQASILPWLTRANSSTAQVLDQLGLTPDDCGKYHIRGSCQHRNCTRQHISRALDPRHVDAVIAVLHHGRLQMM